MSHPWMSFSHRLVDELWLPTIQPVDKVDTKDAPVLKGKGHRSQLYPFDKKGLEPPMWRRINHNKP